MVLGRKPYVDDNPYSRSISRTSVIPPCTFFKKLKQGPGGQAKVEDLKRPPLWSSSKSSYPKLQEGYKVSQGNDLWRRNFGVLKTAV